MISKGTIVTWSPPYTPELNGKVECNHQTSEHPHRVRKRRVPLNVSILARAGAHAIMMRVDTDMDMI